MVSFQGFDTARRYLFLPLRLAVRYLNHYNDITEIYSCYRCAHLAVQPVGFVSGDRSMVIMMTEIPFWRLRTLLLVGTAAIALTGCSIGESYRFSEGAEPSLQDDNVRFRTTYYFRTFDVCEDEDQAVDEDSVFPRMREKGRRLQNDSLYRFRMTGKASPYLDRVHFESGTLQAHQIDPFGASVHYDETNKHFTVLSAQEAAEEAKRKATAKTIDELLAMRDRLRSEEVAVGAIDEAITEHVGRLGLNGQKGSAISGKSEGPTQGQGASTSGTDCQKARRGFQVLGPEGWRTFNQNERLLMAMAVDSKPLIGVLQKISSSVTDNRAGMPAVYQGLAKERVALSGAKAANDAADKDGKADARIEAVLKAFDQPANVPAAIKSTIATEVKR
ncbi:MAG: hypothetical protein ABT940_01795 [Alphaproteobacteria bacterium]